MSEEQQHNKNLEHARDFAKANVQEVAGQAGMRTFIVDCSRKSSNKYRAVGRRAGKKNQSSWTNKANGLVVKRGDQISIEAVALNSPGASPNTIEV